MTNTFVRRVIGPVHSSARDVEYQFPRVFPRSFALGSFYPYYFQHGPSSLNECLQQEHCYRYDNDMGVDCSVLLNVWVLCFTVLCSAPYRTARILAFEFADEGRHSLIKMEVWVRLHCCLAAHCISYSNSANSCNSMISVRESSWVSPPQYQRTRRSKPDSHDNLKRAQLQPLADGDRMRVGLSDAGIPQGTTGF